jgi:O-antigen ligase
MITTKKIPINMYSILLYCIAFYTLATLIYSWIPQIQLSRLFGMCIALTTICIYIHKLTLKKIYLLLFCGFIFVYTMLISQNRATNLNDSLWYITTILLIGVASNNNFSYGVQNAIYNNKKQIKIIIFLIQLVLLISVFTPSSYGNGWNWGEDTSYFKGFSKNGHTFASACCLLIVLIMSVYHEKKIKLIEYLYYLLPVYSILFSGVRTFLISVLVLVVINIYSKIRSDLKRRLLLLIVLFCFVIVLFNSSMMNKFEYTANNQYAKNILDSISNGRSEFWFYDVQLYINSNYFYKILGHGFDYIYQYNLKTIGISIWAHNDIINNLVSVGLFGTLIYLIVWLLYLRFFSKRLSNSKNKYIISVLFLIYIFAPMLLNGLYAYQHYIFSCVILGPLLIRRTSYL